MGSVVESMTPVSSTSMQEASCRWTTQDPGSSQIVRSRERGGAPHPVAGRPQASAGTVSAQDSMVARMVSSV
jgi:hypothetical protein